MRRAHGVSVRTGENHPSATRPIMDHRHALAIPIDNAVVRWSASFRWAQAAAVGQHATAYDRPEQRPCQAGDRALAQLNAAGVVGNARGPGPLRERLGSGLAIAKNEDLSGGVGHAENRPIVRSATTAWCGEEESPGDREGVRVAAPRRMAAALGHGRVNVLRQQAIWIAMCPAGAR